MYCKELVHTVLEADESQYLQLAFWRASQWIEHIIISAKMEVQLMTDISATKWKGLSLHYSVMVENGKTSDENLMRLWQKDRDDLTEQKEMMIVMNRNIYNITIILKTDHWTALGCWGTTLALKFLFYLSLML
jgi:hypothetical protein